MLWWTGSEINWKGWSIQLSLVRSVSWNYLGYFFEFGSGLLLLAYVVRRVTVQDYGIFLLAQSLAAFLFLLDFGMGNILVPLYVSTFARMGIAEVSNLANTLVVTLLGLGAAGAAALSLAALFIPELIRLPSAQTGLAERVLVAISVAVALALPQIPLEQLCQAFHRFDRVNQVQIAAVVLRVTLTVAVLRAGRGILALALVQAAVSLLRLTGLWIVTSATISGLSLRLRFDGEQLREAMRMSRWAFGDDVSRRIGMNSEQVILAGLASFEQVALFGVSSRLPAHIYQFAARGLSVLLPTFSQHHSEGDTAQLRATFRNAYRVCLTGFVPMVTYGAICARALIDTWLGPAYLRAAPVLAWLLFSTLSMVVMLPSDLILYSHARIPQAVRFSVWETLGKIGLGLALAGRYGAVGVAAGIAVSHWCVNLFCYLPAACGVAGVRPWELCHTALTGNSSGERDQAQRTANRIQGSVYVLSAVALAAGMRVLTSPEMFVAFVLISLLYMAIWANCTAFPMWKRAQMEASAAL